MTNQNEVINDTNYIPVLDYGFVGLIDVMGDDSSIVQAARVSYGKGTKKLSDDLGLIRYLLRHKHTTPFEMVEFKFHCKMPIFVARQWIRHRTASVNEYSARYSEMSDEMYLPGLEQIQPQSTTNKQGRAGELDNSQKILIRDIIEGNGEASYARYKELLPNLSRELARAVMPLNSYTEWYWKIDLHNLFHFLKLRMDSHAQYEIRVFADAMYEIIKRYVPVACKAFEDYSLNAHTFSGPEMKMIKEIFKTSNIYLSKENLDVMLSNSGLSSREKQEFVNKLLS